MGYRVKRANLELDRKRIIGFWNHYHGTDLQEKYERFYLKNPAGAARVWFLLEDGNDRIQGLNTLFSRHISVNGYKYRAAIAGDFFVAPRHRSLGPAMMLHKKATAATQRGEIDFIYGFPNEKAEGVIKRAGYQHLGNITRLVRVVDYSPYLTDRGLGEGFCRLIAPVLNRFYYLASMKSLCVIGHNVICRRIRTTDKRFDGLWEKAKGKYAAIGERSSAYLQWRYLSGKNGSIFIATDKEDQRLYGYMACTMNDGALNIRDFFIPQQAEVVSCLLRSVFQYGYGMAVRSININFLTNNALESFFRKYGFVRRNHSRKIFVYAPRVRKGHRMIIGNVENWLLLSGDNDC